MKFPRRFDASLSRAEFRRLLPRATGEGDVYETAEGFAGAGWQVRLTPMEPLCVGSVCLERWRVDVELSGMTAAQEDTFMRRFSMHYQRGGG